MSSQTPGTLGLDASSPAAGPAKAGPPVRAPWPFVVVFLFGLGLTGYLLWPFFSALFIAATLAATSYTLFARLSRFLGRRPSAAAAALSLALFAFIIAPLASIITVAVREVTGALQWMRDSLGVTSIMELSLSNLPPAVEQGLARVLELLHISRPDLQDYVGRTLSMVQAWAPAALSLSFNAAFGTLFVLVAYYFLLVDGSSLVAAIVRLSPLPTAQTQELFNEFRQVSSAALWGSAVTSAVVGAVVAIGFAVVQAPHALFFGLVTLLAGFVPVVGSAIVWVPAVVVLALSGRVGAAIGLGIWCALGVAVADNILKPLLMRGKSEIHVGLMFLGLLGGIAMFGISGIIAGPVIIAFFLAMVRIYWREYGPRPAPQES